MNLFAIPCGGCGAVAPAHDAPVPHTDACVAEQRAIDARNAVRVHAVRVDGPVRYNATCGLHLAPCGCP